MGSYKSKGGTFSVVYQGGAIDHVQATEGYRGHGAVLGLGLLGSFQGFPFSLTFHSSSKTAPFFEGGGPTLPVQPAVFSVET